MFTDFTSRSHSTPVELEKEDYLEIPAEAGSTKEFRMVVSRRQILKWFGAISSILLSAAALVPNIFRIPANFQPWVFLTTIFWVLAFCAGMFDL
jgi:hypothetical protein